MVTPANCCGWKKAGKPNLLVVVANDQYLPAKQATDLEKSSVAGRQAEEKEKHIKQNLRPC